MMSEQPKVTLQWGTESGDGKRAYIYAKENDGWKDLRLELDTDDCDGEHARAMMQVVIDRCNAPTTAPTPPESAPQSAPAQGETRTDAVLQAMQGGRYSADKCHPLYVLAAEYESELAELRKDNAKLLNWTTAIRDGLKTIKSPDAQRIAAQLTEYINTTNQ